MTDVLGVSGVARLLGVKPSQITDLFYKRQLRDDLCPIVAGRRLIPPSYVRIIAMELRRKGIHVKDPECREPKSRSSEKEVSHDHKSRI